MARASFSERYKAQRNGTKLNSREEEKSSSSARISVTGANKRGSFSERYRTQKLERSIGFDTFESDLASASDLVNSVYGGWNDAETMSKSHGTVSSMYDRLNKYKEYVNISASDQDLTKFNSEMDTLIGAYGKALGDWDALSKEYSQFKNADAYKNYKKVAAEREAEEKKSAFDEYRHLLDDEEFMKNANYDSAKKNMSFWDHLADKSDLYEVNKETKDGLLYDIDHALSKAFPTESTKYQYLTDDEKAVYYGLHYLDKNQADEFLDKMSKELNERMTDADLEGQREFAQMNGLTGTIASIGALGNNLIGGISSLKSDIKNLITGEEVDANDYAHIYTNRADALTGAVSEDIGESTDTKVLPFLYDTGMSIANSALNLVLLGGSGSLANMSTQAYSSKMKEMQDRGASQTEMILTSALAAGIEAITEKIPMDNLLKPKGVTTLRRFIGETMRQAGIEATEEGVSSILNQTVDVLSGQLGGTSEFKNQYEDYLLRGYTEDEAKKEVAKGALEETLLSALGGAISGGFMGGISNTMEGAENRNIGKFVTNNNRLPELTDLATEVGPIGKGKNAVDYAAQLQNSPNKATIGYAYKNIAEEANRQADELDRSETKELIMRRLVEMGESGETAMALADAIIADGNGKSSAAQRRMIENSGIAAEAIQDIKNNAEWTTKSTEGLRKAQGLRNKLKSISTMRDASVVKAEQRASEMNISDTTTDIETGKEIDIEGVRFDENGEAVLQTSEGERKISEVTLTSNNAIAVAYAEDMDREMADTFVSLYDGKQDFEAYKDSFNLVWSYGQDGYGSDSVLSHLGNLTESQALSIYKAGMTSEVAKAQKAVNAIKKQYKGFAVKGSFDDSVIDYTGADSKKINFNDLSDNQKQNIVAAKAISEGLGLKVELFSSRHGENKANGYYDPKTNTIGIDVFAEQKGGSLNNGIMTAMSHEMTHWMKNKSPKLYNEMRELVMNNLSRAGGVSGDVLARIEAYKMDSRHGGNASDSQAIDELIARACEDMLSNSKTANSILENMSAESRADFVDKIKEFLSKIKEAIASIMGRFDSESREAVMLREMDGMADKMAELWDSMLEDSVETNSEMAEEVEEEELLIAASDKQFSVKENVVDVNGTLYPKVIVLDSEYNDVVKNPKAFATFVYENLIHQEIEVIDKDGNVEKIEFAKENERVKKDGAKNPHKVVDKLAQANGSTKRVVIANLPEVIKNSEYFEEHLEHSHQWLDERGWEIRNCAVMMEGEDIIYPVLLSIGKARDGRNVLYAVNVNVKEGVAIEKGATNNAAVEIANPSKDSITQPGENTSRIFSDKDSEGTGLTDAQIRHFAESKMRDERGKLKPMYHGTEMASFTVFDTKHSDDGISLFFTDNKRVAKGYSGTYEEYVPGKKYTVDELTDIIGNSYLFVEEEDGKYNIVRNRYGEFINEYTTDTLEEMQEYVLAEYASVGAGNYKVYLNLTNPLVIDADGNNWDELAKFDAKTMTKYDYILATKSGDGKYLVEWADASDEYGESELENGMSLDDIEARFGRYVRERIEGSWTRETSLDGIIVDKNTHELIPNTTREYAYFAKKNGYDGVIFNDIYDIAVHAAGSEKYESSTVAIAFDSNQVKSVYNENPTDADDIRYSDKGSDGDELGSYYKNLARKLERENDYLKLRHENYKARIEKARRIEQITKKALRMNNLLKKNSKDYHVPEILKEPLEAVLSALDFSSKSFLKKGEPTGKDVRLAEAFSNLQDVLIDIDKAQINEEDINGIYGHFDMPEGFVEYVRDVKQSINDTIGRMSGEPVVLNRLTKDELDNIYDILTILNKSITQMDKALSTTKAMRISAIADTTKNYLESIHKMGDELPLMQRMKKFLAWDNELPVYGMSRFGEGGDIIMDSLQNGWDKLAFNVDRVVKHSEETYKKEQLKEWEKSTKTFTVANGNKRKEITLTDAQIMSLYCLSKREQAMGHILGNGITIASHKVKSDGKIKVDKLTQKDHALITGKELKNIISSLSSEQIAVADSLQKFMNTVCAEWGNQVSMVRFGIKSFGEENYFPIKSDANVIESKASESGDSLFRLLNLSFTKSLTKNANNAIMVESVFDVFANHASDMAKYNALALPVLDAFKWYSAKGTVRDKSGRVVDSWSLKRTMDDAYGESAKGFVRGLLLDMNGASSGGQDLVADSIAKKMMSNYKVASVAANLRVAILQPTSYMRAGLVLDKKYLTKALVTSESTLKNAVEKAKETCGIALWKSMGFYDTNISRGVAKLIKHDESVLDVVKDKSLILAEKGDEITWGLLYRACLLEQKEKNPGMSGDALDKAVADRLREVIYKTQVVDSTLTRTQTMRSKSAWSQMLTSFMSEPSVSWSILSDVAFKWMVEARGGNHKRAFAKYGQQMKNAAMTYLITATTAAIMGAIPDALRDDDEDKNLPEKFARSAVQNLLSDVTGLLPYVRDIFNMAQGFQPSRMDQQAFTSIINGIKGMQKGEITYKKVYTLVKGISQATGIPMSNIMREFKTLWNATVGNIYSELK